MEKYCNMCGAQIEEGDKVCWKCGEQLVKNMTDVNSLEVDKRSSKKLIKRVIIVAVLVGMLAILAIVGLKTYNYVKPENKFARKVMNAYVSYDAGKLVDLSSELVLDYAEDDVYIEDQYMEYMVLLDDMEEQVGYGCKFKYTITDCYEMSKRKLENLKDQYAGSDELIDTDAMKEVKAVNVLLTAKKSGHKTQRRMTLLIDKENSHWRLLQLQY